MTRRILQCVYCEKLMDFYPDLPICKSPADHTIWCRNNYDRMLKEGLVKDLKDYANKFKSHEN